MNEKTIQRYVSEAYAALAAAKEIANEMGTSFSFDPAWGMGGTYYSPEYVKEHEYLQNYYDLDPQYGGWVSSSQTC